MNKILRDIEAGTKAANEGVEALTWMSAEARQIQRD
jgi:hypothetical protein